MSKSKRTQYRYAKQWKGQTGLTQFGFKVMPSSSTIPKTCCVSEIDGLSNSEGVESDQDSEVMVLNAPIHEDIPTATHSPNGELSGV